ncbi:hypothetical protein KC973_03135 [Candidatus Saccharibacteria bacterium]|nr:hypothetical protein [Candidatus Saccharibacteria bacterium]
MRREHQAMWAGFWGCLGLSVAVATGLLWNVWSDLSEPGLAVFAAAVICFFASMCFAAICYAASRFG